MERPLRWENTRNTRRADKTESLVFSCFGCSLTLVELINGKGLNRSGVLLLLAVLYMVIMNEDIQRYYRVVCYLSKTWTQHLAVGCYLAYKFAQIIIQ